ncbi:dihydrolipoyl dehydrogenase [Rhizocola hellebori]|uniref:Dihydrolipoyl dehydrogenase n=1 Tax=Rhizocola hellebori TaxID=1392758 RepID=A0A8J3VK62_9ACTN|nr:dihydrolipoyl dehydrogenase [Rhizocola hellebori]GIH08771.1 dihydrolipoyl dehydrogenase [Rhizocola hellebori]
MSDTFDVVILGGGSGGYATALRASQLGLSVALIEKDKLGGTCLHRGCIPTKALLHAGEIADQTREAAHFGINAELIGVDMKAINGYKDGVVAGLYKGLQGLVKHAKVTYIEGTGKLAGPNVVEVNGQEIIGRNVVLATGSYSKTLPGLEIDGNKVLASEEALTMDRVPASAIVLGGGVIGVEFASAWKSLGAEVTIVEALPRLVAAEDPDISKQLERAFRKRGINFKVGKAFEKLEKTASGVKVTIAGGETIEAELLLVAVGRGPSTANCGYEEQGVKMERGFVLTDERLRTNVPNVYAVGDIVPGLQLAHRGFQQGIFVAEEIAGKNPAPIVESGIPRVTYCDPEIASVGVTEAQAKERFGDDSVETYNYNLGGNGRSKILGTQGFVKLVRQKDGPVVGVHMIGARIGEQVGEAQLIVNWEAFPAEVAQLVHAHPTQNEALGEAHLALAGKPLHAHN